ncbi:hypothetical protein Lal_00008023 [Lupinus albus]|nr:hypothetical protein Lal_00008023 [Lupinus albus]
MTFLAQARQLSLRRESSSIAQDFTFPDEPLSLKREVYEDDLKADELATPETNFPRDYGPQRNHRQGRGKDRVGDYRKPYAAITVHRDRNFQRSGSLTVPTEGVSTPMCNKCGKLHYGSTCPGKGNGCFHCKEFGHNKRFCPKINRRLNVIHDEEARDHDRKVTPSGAGTSGVDGPARGNSPEEWGILPDSRLSERTSTKREDQCFEIGKIVGVSPKRGMGRLSERKPVGIVRFSPERESLA